MEISTENENQVHPGKKTGFLTDTNNCYLRKIPDTLLESPPRTGTTTEPRSSEENESDARTQQRERRKRKTSKNQERHKATAPKPKKTPGETP